MPYFSIQSKKFLKRLKFMGSNKTTVDYILEQINNAGKISAKKMFGEYGIYCDEKIVALVCDDQLFIKPTQAGKDFIRTFIESSPYPGAKPYLLIAGEHWDDHEWLSTLIRITADHLPLPKKAKPKTRLKK